MTRPDVLIVCDHGVRGGALDPAALLPWFPDRPGWWPAEGVDEHIRLWLMEGTSRGWDPWQAVHPTEPDHRREALEIPCPETRCSRRPYRTDGDKLQVLLTAIADDAAARTLFTVRADERVIVITLESLHAARDLAKQHGLPV